MSKTEVMWEHPLPPGNTQFQDLINLRWVLLILCVVTSRRGQILTLLGLRATSVCPSPLLEGSRLAVIFVYVFSLEHKRETLSWKEGERRRGDVSLGTTQGSRLTFLTRSTVAPNLKC